MGYSREKIVKQAKAWLGCKESDGSHKKIIDIYNAHAPLARGYKVQYTDAWCATFVSAVSIKCGYTNIIPTECGCDEMIKKFKNLGEWQESDSYTPAAGDIIFYDWQDTGSGDNTGSADHVGIVEKVSGKAITVIEGNKDNAVGRRTIQVNGRFIRGYGLPKYTEKASDSSESTPTQGAADAKTVWNYLMKKIGNAYGVAGLIGNLYAESALIPTNLQDSFESKLGYTDDTYTAAVDNGSYSNFAKDSAGYGLAQWTYWTRKRDLLAYAKEQGKSIGDLQLQLDFLMKELSDSYGSLLKTLKAATSVFEASNAVLLQFERPADTGVSVQSKRSAYGQKYYDAYAGASTAVKEQKATDAAEGFNKTIAGTYQATDNLNVRNGAGTGKAIMCTITKGTKVQNYGYFTEKDGVKWLYVQFTLGGVKYTGFCSGEYLKKV